MKVRYTSQKYKSRPNEDRFIARRVFRSSGIGCAMISLKKSSPSSILLSHSERASGWRSLHQNSVRRAIGAFSVASPRASS